MGGGVAIAQDGLVPRGVLESMGLLTKGQGIKLSTTPVKIADIHLSDGTRWQVWRGLNDHKGSCYTVGDPDRGGIPNEDIFGSAHASCSFMPDDSDLPPGWKVDDWNEQEHDFARLEFYGNDERNGLPVVFGQVVQSEVKSVRVVGPGYTKRLRIHPKTGGFGAELPYRLGHSNEDNLFDQVHIEFLDGDGDVVHDDFNGG